MVQILKPQIRNYQADQTAVIEQQQTAQFISDVGGVMQGVANIYNAYKKDVEADKKKAEQADQDIINTEIGEQANIQASIEAKKALGSKDPSSEAGMTAINEAYIKAFAPYDEQMGSERGKILLRTKQRQGADAYIKSAIKEYSSEKAVKARQAAANVESALNFNAEDLGKSGNIDGFDNVTSKHVTTLAEYAKAHGEDPEQISNNMRVKAGDSYLKGFVSAHPIEAAAMFGVDESARDQMIDLLRKQNPSLSRREAGAEVDAAIERKKGWSNEQLDKIYSKEGIDWIREQRKKQLEQERDKYGEKSPVYKQAQEKIKSLEGDGIYNILREEARAVYGPMVNRSVQEHILEEDKLKYENVVSLLDGVNSPDLLVSSSARQWLKESLKTSDGWDNLSRAVHGELSVENLQKSISQQEKNIEDVKMQLHPTYTGTSSIGAIITDLASDETSTPAQLMLKGTDALNKIHTLEITDGQEKVAQSIVHNILKDKVGAELFAKTFDATNKYFPELNWMQRYMSQSLTLDQRPDLVAKFTGGQNVDIENKGSLRQNRSSKAQTEKMIEAKLLRLNETALTMANQALQMNGDERVRAMKGIEEFIVSGKQSIFDETMAEYGINMPPLREKLKLGQPVYVQIGFKTKQYLGDNPDGTPKFVDWVDPTAEAKRKALLERLPGAERFMELVSKKGE